MTASERISADLAIVARASRARPIALETTLQRVGARREAVGEARPHDLVLVAMARVFALRVARIAVGAYVIACVLGSIAYTLVPWDVLDWYQLDEILGNEHTIHYVGVMALVYLAALRIAHGRFRDAVARIADPVARGRQLAERVERPSLAIGIAGMMTFAIWYLTIRHDGLLLYLRADQGDDWTEVDTIRSLAPLVVAMVASVFAAIRISRIRRDWSVPRWALPIALPVFAVLLVDLQYYLDLVPAATAVCAVPLFVIVAAWHLARRRTESIAMEAS